MDHLTIQGDRSRSSISETKTATFNEPSAASLGSFGGGERPVESGAFRQTNPAENQPNSLFSSFHQRSSYPPHEEDPRESFGNESISSIDDFDEIRKFTANLNRNVEILDKSKPLDDFDLEKYLPPPKAAQPSNTQKETSNKLHPPEKETIPQVSEFYNREFSERDVLPPPITLSEKDVPPPPIGFSGKDVPPPPTGFSEKDVPPPPIGFSQKDVPPPPVGFSDKNLAPREGGRSDRELAGGPSFQPNNSEVPALGSTLSPTRPEEPSFSVASSGILKITEELGQLRELGKAGRKGSLTGTGAVAPGGNYRFAASPRATSNWSSKASVSSAQSKARSNPPSSLKSVYSDSQKEISRTGDPSSHFLKKQAEEVRANIARLLKEVTGTSSEQTQPRLSLHVPNWEFVSEDNLELAKERPSLTWNISGPERQVSMSSPSVIPVSMPSPSAHPVSLSSPSVTPATLSPSLGPSLAPSKAPQGLSKPPGTSTRAFEGVVDRAPFTDPAFMPLLPSLVGSLSANAQPGFFQWRRVTFMVSSHTFAAKDAKLVSGPFSNPNFGVLCLGLERVGSACVESMVQGQIVSGKLRLKDLKTYQSVLLDDYLPIAFNNASLDPSKISFPYAPILPGNNVFFAFLEKMAAKLSGSYEILSRLPFEKLLGLFFPNIKTFVLSSLPPASLGFISDQVALKENLLWATGSSNSNEAFLVKQFAPTGVLLENPMRELRFESPAKFAASMKSAFLVNLPFRGL